MNVILLMTTGSVIRAGLTDQNLNSALTQSLNSSNGQAFALGQHIVIKERGALKIDAQ